MRRSLGSISTSTSSASGSTRTTAALELQSAPRAVAAARANSQGGIAVPAEIGLVGVEHLGLPALPLGVAQVHPHQVAGEQRRLLTALTGLDLKDHVLAVVGVAGYQQGAQFLRGGIAPAFEVGHLRPKGRIRVAEL